MRTQKVAQVMVSCSTALMLRRSSGAREEAVTCAASSPRASLFFSLTLLLLQHSLEKRHLWDCMFAIPPSHPGLASFKSIRSAQSLAWPRGCVRLSSHHTSSIFMPTTMLLGGAHHHFTRQPESMESD